MNKQIREKSQKIHENTYNSNMNLIKNLKQEEIPNDSEEEPQENNDQFLEELERENKLLEKELDSLLQMKKSYGLNSEVHTNKDPNLGYGDTRDLKNNDKTGLEKIEEKTEEEHPSYCYSNSEDENHIGSKNNNKKLDDQSFTERTDGFSDTHTPKYDMIDLQSSNRSKKQKSTYGGNNPTDGTSPHQNTDKYNKIAELPFTQTAATSDNDVIFNQTTVFKSKQTNNDKENVNNQNKFSSSASKTRLSSRSKSKEVSASPPKNEKNDKVSSLEYRLVGANKAIRALEKDMKAKDDKIQELMKEIEKKNKQLEMQQSQSQSKSNQSQISQIPNPALTAMRKREKALEKKIKDQDTIISENKKYMIRLQELNAKLLAKVKQIEEENETLKKKLELPSDMNLLEDENKSLKSSLQEAEEIIEEYKNKEKIYDEKLKQMVQLYVNMELKSEKFIEKNKNLNDTLLNLITRHHNNNNNKMAGK